ncbi:cation-translocating P-type ATPase [Haladaptatus sp. GCM10025707]|uniref:heavy metal translocating P-type ATPase n=1 Tax=unclassified Haladaptatus TaxID=2622732 RepID=UPI0023E7FBED|nr:cation-translocating P-type ATPase [Haladaptatus sp. QDMS2]
MTQDSGGPTDPPAGTQRISLSVPDMDCPSCAEKIVNSVSTLDGIHEVEPQVMTGTVTVTYDPDDTDINAIEERITAAGYRIESPTETQTESLRVPEMDCPSCAGKIETELAALAGVLEYDTVPTTGSVVVSYNPTETDHDAVVAAIERAGYAVEATEREEGEGKDAQTQSVWTSPRALKTWTGALLLALGAIISVGLPSIDVVLFELFAQQFTVSGVLFFASAVVAGQEIVRNGYYSARTLSLDIDLLMSLGILGALTASLAFGESLFWEAGMLAVLFSVAELMERYAMDRARSSLRELVDLSPDTATIRRNGDEHTVPVEDLEIGDVTLVRPGEKIPADGVVVEGASAVNQAPITGESLPADKTTGDEVYAGTINEEGYLEVEVTAEASESTLARIIELVEDAQRDRTEHERFVDRFAGYYTPVVVTFAVLVAIVQPVVFGRPWATGFTQGLALLVLACPCALVISTPVSVISGITSAARNGVLIKGGTHLEAMGAVDVVAFDKTGTLTKGELTVTDVVPLGGTTREQVLATAARLEARSEHPIAESIVAAADAEGFDRSEVTSFESLTGKGVRADLDGETYYAGNPALFEDLGVDLGHVHAVPDGGVLATEPSTCDHGEYYDLRTQTITQLQEQGKTVVLVGTVDGIEGVIAVADELRSTAADTVARLHDQGIEHVVMLTGDNQATADAIGASAGVDAVYAELLPEEKATVVRELEAEYGTVAMVGDGINDAPALATATVGIAMGAAGTDTAIESANIALMGDDLSKLPYLHRLSQTAGSVIQQNIWSSIGVKVLLALGVPFGLVNVALAIIVGDMGMSLAVTTNALRLSRVSPDGVSAKSRSSGDD